LEKFFDLFFFFLGKFSESFFLFLKKTKERKNNNTNSSSSSNDLTCSSVAHPITFSTPALLYHDLSKITISPAEGRCFRYRCQYH